VRRRTKQYYCGHIIYVEPVSPGVWRYRVYTVRQYRDRLVRHGTLVCDAITFTRWAARARAKRVARTREYRNARYP
jgi:hypothetical protein